MSTPHPSSPEKKPTTMRDRFVSFSKWTSAVVGSVWAFIAAIVIILGWAGSGPIFKYSDTWQLVINTGTTIVTFLMVFLIQSTQNRDAKAIHLKLDELIRAIRGARNNFVDLESLSEEELEQVAEEFSRLGQRACGEVKRRRESGGGKRLGEESKDSIEELQDAVERKADEVIGGSGEER